MHDACAFRVDMSELHLYDGLSDHAWFTPPAACSYKSMWPSWLLLKSWAAELQHEYDITDNQIWHSCMHERSHFAHMLRQLDWRVYYFRDTHGLDGVMDVNTHRNYGRSWGYIVAPYCGKFVFWQLCQS